MLTTVPYSDATGIKNIEWDAVSPLIPQLGGLDTKQAQRLVTCVLAKIASAFAYCINCLIFDDFNITLACAGDR